MFRPVIDAYVIKYLLDSEIEIEFLSQEIRAYLIEILSSRIRFDNKYQKLSTIIDKFILGCFDFLNPDIEDSKSVINIDINTFEELMK